MKFLKTTAAAALTLAFSQGALAADDMPTVYGKINVTVQSSDDGDGSFSEIKSNASRFGIKGDLSLSESLEAVYKLEWQVDVSDNSNGSDDNIKSRNQYLGLRGNFGEVLVGRNDTVLKQSQGKVDLFNDYEGDLKNLWKGENRVNDSITYMSPSYSGFRVGMTYIVEDEKDGDDGYSLAAFYGDKELKKSQYYVSIAMDDQVKDYDSVRATAQAKFGDFKVGGSYHKQELSEGVDTDSESGFMFSTQYSLTKEIALKAQYQELEDDDTISIGADYKLGKKTKLFAWYSDMSKDNDNSEKYFAVGMEHKF